MLIIKDLKANLADTQTEILKGIDLRVNAGEIHAIMGPNGSGKSTLASVLAGKEIYEVTRGSASLDGIDLLDMEPEERAIAGLFLAFQYPIEIPGVSIANFIKTAVNSKREANGEKPLNAKDFLIKMRSTMAALDINPEFMKRSVNEGFSGGEKKRNEILQMAMLEPKLAILDETDSGLDIDALKIVAEGVNKLKSDKTAVVVITHYQRLLDYIIPDFVHILYQGKIVKSGDKSLALHLEENGYDWIKEEALAI